MSGLAELSSDQLLTRLLELVHRGCELEADLIAHLAEVDGRRLYLREGCPSMFAYCVDVLHFAEAVAYKRIAAARAARRYPEVLTALREGAFHLTAVSLLAPQLTAENVTELLAAARHRTADEIRRMLADRRPKPDATSSVRRLSAPPIRAVERFGESIANAKNRKTALESESSPRASLPVLTARLSDTVASSAGPPEPLGEDRYLIRFTADRELHGQIQQLKALMRHQIPDGDVGKILAKAAAVLLKQVRAQKFGECSSPRAARSERAAQVEGVESAVRAEPAVSIAPSRQIPAAIRRAVSKRDDERCTFVSANGRRCGSCDFLEFHHREPWARSRAHAIDGITLRCRAHNQYEAERDFGAKHMKRFRRRSQSETAMSVAETSSILVDAEAMLAPLSPSTALRRKLELNPVGGKP
jgi:hypothetical protein